MSTFITEVRETLAPSRSDRFGPLPPLLIAMTVVTGLVDAFSYLVLGHVFVANMTGNVIFLGLAVADAQEFSVPASLVAMGAFMSGALAGGRLGAVAGRHRARLLAIGTLVNIGLIGAARELDLPPDTLIYVGDDERDMRAGLAAGMRVVAARYGYLGSELPPEQWNAHAIVDAPGELLGFIDAAK